AASRLLLLLAIFFSAALVSNRLRLGASYCGFGHGCEDVQSSLFSKPLGIPLPVLGLVGFTVLYGLSFLTQTRGQAVYRTAAVSAGLLGLCLLAIQAFVIHSFCTICVVVDVASVAVGALAIIRSIRKEPASGPGRLATAAWLGGILLVIGASLAAPYLRPEAAAPAQIQAFWV